MNILYELPLRDKQLVVHYYIRALLELWTESSIPNHSI